MHGNALKAILHFCPLIQDGEDRWYGTQTCLGFSRSDQMWQQPLGNAKKCLPGWQGSPEGVGWAWHCAWRGTRIKSCSLLSYLSLNQFNSMPHARIAHIPGVNLGSISFLSNSEMRQPPFSDLFSLHVTHNRKLLEW